MFVVLAEKPSVAKDIARVLGAHQKRLGYFWGNNYAITWAFGHIIELIEPEDYKAQYKKWNLADLPIIPDAFRMRISKNKGAKQQYQAISTLFNAKETEKIICATDAGREGELIFRYIYKHCRCSKPIERLWISSQTDLAIKEGFAKLQSGEKYIPLYESALSRSEADWLIGMNATRAYTLKFSQGAGVMSVGRVQTPVLKMLVDRYEKHTHFVPQKYKELQALFEHLNGSYKGIYIDSKKESRIFDAEKALELKKELSKHKKGHIHLLKCQLKEEKPPLLYDLTSLQKEANQKFKYSADKTLSYLQSLYERHKIISYPRTSSRYLSSDLRVKIPFLFKGLQTIETYQPFLEKIITTPLSFTKRIVDDKKVTDHHAIIITEQKPRLHTLSVEEKNLFDLIVRRFICVFYPPCQKQVTEIITHVHDMAFKTTGTSIKKAGWRELYMKEEKKEDFLPQMQKGDSVQLKACNLLEKQTKPPPLYTEATLLAAMETAGKDIDDDEMRQAMKDCGLGTAATRAQILERLIFVKYMLREKNHLLPTEKGKYLIKNIQSQVLMSADLTGEFEKKLNNIVRGSYTRKKYMQDIRSFTQQVVEKVKGAPMSSHSLCPSLGPCPLCQSDVVERKNGYGCKEFKIKGCPFIIWKEIAKKKISSKQASLLLKEKQSSLIKNFQSRSGKRFDAYLILTEQGKVLFRLGSPEKKTNVSKHDQNDKTSSHPIEKKMQSCPMCQRNLWEKTESFSCSSCSFTLKKIICEKKLTLKQIETLLTKKKTALIKGFKGRTGKKFAAKLLLSQEGRVLFKPQAHALN